MREMNKAKERKGKERKCTLPHLRYLPGKQGCLKYRTKGLRLVVGYRDGWIGRMDELHQAGVGRYHSLFI